MLSGPKAVALVPALLAGCGDAAGGLGDAELWAFGGGDVLVVSSPVVDRDGNYVVLAALNAEPDEGNEIGPCALAVVSLTADGTGRWRSVIDENATLGLEALHRAAIGPGGDVWVCHGAALMRLGNTDGAIRWVADGGCPFNTAFAVGSDGSYFAIVYDDGPKLRRTDANGQRVWSFDPGTTAPLLKHWYDTELEGIALDASGGVLTGCDTCVPDQPTLARVDPASGASTVVFVLPGTQGHTPASYSAPLVDGTSVHLGIGSTSWRFDGSGSVGVDDWPAPFLSAGDTVGWRPGSDVDRRRQVVWGDDVFPVESLPGGSGLRVQPVAVVDPGYLVVHHVESGELRNAPCRGDAATRCGLSLVDRDGDVAWQHARGPGFTIPHVGDGFLVYPDVQRRLVAVEAPVTGLAAGTWPSLGGDSQGTNSAEP